MSQDSPRQHGPMDHCRVSFSCGVYRAVWPQHDISLIASDIEDDGVSITATIRVCVASIGRLVWGPTVANLLSTRDIVGLGKAISEDCILGDMSWARLLQEGCAAIVDEYRNSGSYMRISDVPEPDRAARYHIADFLLNNQTTLLVADGQAGKSYLALYLAVCVATGYPFLDSHRIVRQGSVVYVDYETDEEVQAERIYRICRGLGMHKVPENIFTCVERRPIRLAAPVIRRIAEHEQAALVIVDSLGPACAGELEKAQTALSTMQSISRLGECTKLVIAHLPKASRNTGDRTAIGSIYFQNLARSAWSLERGEGTDPCVVNCMLRNTKANIGRRLAPIAYRVNFVDGDPWEVRFSGLSPYHGEVVGFLPLRDRVLKAIDDGVDTVAEIADYIYETDKAVQAEIASLVSAGVLSRFDDGGKKRFRRNLDD